MKISKSKQELARIISENGGWRKGAEWAALEQQGGDVWLCAIKPLWCVGVGIFSFKDRVKTIPGSYKLPNIHQAILSRAEYLHLYPAPDADGWIELDGKHEPAVATSGLTLWCKWSDGLEQSHEANMVDWVDDSDVRIIAYRLHKPEQAKSELCESVVRSTPEPDEQVWENPPTIEQLAADYRNAKDYAGRKQQEADAAKVDADARLKALEIAGEALGLLVSPITAKQEPELAITDWWDLQTGDLVWVEEEDGWVAEGEYEVLEVEVPDYDGKRTIRIRGGEGGNFWINYENGWRFIRRP